MTGWMLGDALRATPAPDRARPRHTGASLRWDPSGTRKRRAPPEEETRRAPAIPARAAQADFDDPAVAFLPSGSSADLLR